MSAIKDCWCVYCGHPVLAEGVALDSDDDFDHAGHDRDRCADTACQSSAVATYQGGVLVVADDWTNDAGTYREDGSFVPR